MSETKPKKKKWRRILLLGFAGLVVVFAIIYWIVATEKFSPTKDRKATYEVSAIDFIREFRQNDSVANAKYNEKIVVVNGVVNELDSPDSATINLKIVDTTTGDYAIFAFQEQYLAEARGVKLGDSVSIKGSCSGSNFSEILGVHTIQFKRSTLNK